MQKITLTNNETEKLSCIVEKYVDELYYPDKLAYKLEKDLKTIVENINKERLCLKK